MEEAQLGAYVIGKMRKDNGEGEVDEEEVWKEVQRLAANKVEALEKAGRWRMSQLVKRTHDEEEDERKAKEARAKKREKDEAGESDDEEEEEESEEEDEEEEGEEESKSKKGRKKGAKGEKGFRRDRAHWEKGTAKELLKFVDREQLERQVKLESDSGSSGVQ